MKQNVISAEELEHRLYVRPIEIARLVGIHESGIYRAIYSGALKAQKFGGKSWIVRREDALAWIEANSESNAA